jgi:sugar phosphate isomerase/epimerase
MKLGVFTVLFGKKPFEEMLDYVANLGIEAVEIGTGAYPGNTYCRPDELLESSGKLRAFIEAISRRGLVISALSCHGNPIHPQRKRAEADHRIFTQTLALARRLDVDTVITFSGCPGGGPQAREPNWIISPWPPEFSEMLEWQWRERVIPYWKDAAKAARSAGVRIAIEMHPNFIAYHPESMLRLRDVAPGTIGCNFDPSHMIWQQIDVTSAIRSLAGSIFHVHAKDCRVDRVNTMRNGVLDSKNYTKERERSWIFRTVGYGSDTIFWKDLVSNLRMVGYDRVVSIEHEDSLMSGAEGLEKAIAFLKPLVITEPAGEAYWA